MSDNLQFTADQLAMATFRLGVENNALLRIVLGNQIQIMEKLGMDITLDENILHDLDPAPEEVVAYAPVFLKAVNPIATQIQNGIWQWAQMNTNLLDDD